MKLLLPYVVAIFVLYGEIEADRPDHSFLKYVGSYSKYKILKAL